MIRKRKKFTNPKAVLLKFEDKELALVDARLQVERQNRPYLNRAEFLREIILSSVVPDTARLSDKPVPCQWCGRLFLEHRLGEHEEKCALNPKWGSSGKAPGAEVQELVQFRRWLEDKLAHLEDHLSTKVDVLEQFQFRGRTWSQLTSEEKEKLLLFYIHPAIGGAPRQFRPVQFKEYLEWWGVKYNADVVHGRLGKQDEVAIFLQSQIGHILGKNPKGFYTHNS